MHEMRLAFEFGTVRLFFRLLYDMLYVKAKKIPIVEDVYTDSH